MKAISKLIYKRTTKTKNIIVVLEDEKGEKFFHFTCLFLINVDDSKPSENSKVVRFYNDKVLYKEDIFLSQVSVAALRFVSEQWHLYAGQVVKLKQNQ